MNAESIHSLDATIWLGLLFIFGGVVVLSSVLSLLIQPLREIRNELKNLVAETAYLATIEDEDETEEK
jgi:hypothetical protein